MINFSCPKGPANARLTCAAVTLARVLADARTVTIGCVKFNRMLGSQGVRLCPLCLIVRYGGVSRVLVLSIVFFMVSSTKGFCYGEGEGRWPACLLYFLYFYRFFASPLRMSSYPALPILPIGPRAE